MTKNFLFLSATALSLCSHTILAEQKLTTNQIDADFAVFGIKGGNNDINGNPLKKVSTPFALGESEDPTEDYDYSEDYGEEDVSDEAGPTATKTSSSDPTASGGGVCDYDRCPCGCDPKNPKICLVDTDGDGVVDILEDSHEAANEICDYDPDLVDLHCARKEWFTTDCDNDCFTNYIEWLDNSNPFDECDNKLYTTDTKMPNTTRYYPTPNNVTFAMANMTLDPVLGDKIGLYYPIQYLIYRGHNMISKSYVTSSPVLHVCGSSQCNKDLNNYPEEKDWTAILEVAPDISDENKFPLYQIANSEQITGFYYPPTSNSSEDFYKFEFQDIEINNVIYKGNGIDTNYNQIVSQDVILGNITMLHASIYLNNTLVSGWRPYEYQLDGIGGNLGLEESTWIKVSESVFALQRAWDIEVIRSTFDNVNRVFAIGEFDYNLSAEYNFITEVNFKDVVVQGSGGDDMNAGSGPVLMANGAIGTHIRFDNVTIFNTTAGQSGLIMLGETNNNTQIEMVNSVVHNNTYKDGIFYLRNAVGVFNLSSTHIYDNNAITGILYYDGTNATNYGLRSWFDGTLVTTNEVFTMNVTIGVDDAGKANDHGRDHWETIISNNNVEEHFFIKDSSAEGKGKNINVRFEKSVKFQNESVEFEILDMQVDHQNFTVDVRSYFADISVGGGLFGIGGSKADNLTNQVSLQMTKFERITGCYHTLGNLYVKSAKVHRVDILDNENRDGCPFNSVLVLNTVNAAWSDVYANNITSNVATTVHAFYTYGTSVEFSRSHDFKHSKGVKIENLSNMYGFYTLSKHIHGSSEVEFVDSVAGTTECNAIEIEKDDGTVLVCRDQV